MNTSEKEFEALKSKIVQSVKETLGAEVRTPEGEKSTPCDVHVPYEHLQPDDDEPSAATAVVVYVTYHPVEKRHIVKVKFNYDKSGKFQRNTMSYV